MNIKIVYETQSGTTQYVAEVIESQLRAAGHQVTYHSVKDDGEQPDLTGIDLVLFGGPTYDDGQLERYLRGMVEHFSPDLSKVKVAVFGLGNSTYPHFCTAAQILEEWVAKYGGKLVTETMRVDGFPDDEVQITEFVQRLLAAVA